jgi:Ion channel
MTDSRNDPAGAARAAGPADPESARRHPIRRLARAMVSPDSYGSVLLLILFTYLFSVGVTASWASSLVITVQVGTVWAVLHVSGARRSVRRVAGVLFLISLIAAAVNLFVGKETTGEGAVAFMSAVLYLIAPFSITRNLLFRREVDLQTVLGAIDIYLLVGMLFAFIYRFLGVVQPSAFFGPATGDGKLPQDLFFSFTTLTTTGYGNLVPAGSAGQTFAVAEMLVGQLFLVIAVAKVINAYTPARLPIPGSQTKGKPGESPGSEGS